MRLRASSLQRLFTAAFRPSNSSFEECSSWDIASTSLQISETCFCNLFACRRTGERDREAFPELPRCAYRRRNERRMASWFLSLDAISDSPKGYANLYFLPSSPHKILSNAGCKEDGLQRSRKRWACFRMRSSTLDTEVQWDAGPRGFVPSGLSRTQHSAFARTRSSAATQPMLLF